MNNQPLVSVGIPTFNRPEFLKKAIDSITNQTYKNLEIIISDNCSDSPEVEKFCTEYAKKDSRIKYFRHSENIGMALNGEFVLNQATGKYYMWCMDDDWLSENYIEESLNFMLNNSGYSLVFGDRYFYDADYNYVRHCLRMSYEQEDYTDRIIAYCDAAMKVSLSFGLTTTELAKAAYTTKNRMPEDWIFIFKWLLEGKAKYLDNIRYNAVNLGVSRDIESVKEFFKLPHLNAENYWETLATIVKDAILFDDFFIEKLDETKRTQLASTIYNHLIKNTFAGEEPPKTTKKELLKFMYKKPLFLFRKDFYKKLKEAFSK